MAFDRRSYQRQYATRKREKRFAAERLRATDNRCPKRRGRRACGYPLRTVVDVLGRIHAICDRCERHKRRICADCPKPTVGRSLRCEEHKNAAVRVALERYKREHHEEILVRARRRYQENDELRARRNAYKRARRQLHPEKVRAEKRREGLRQPAYSKRYHARYREKHREWLREMARKRYYAAHPRRPTPTCSCGATIPWHGRGRPPKTCNACVPPSIASRRKPVVPRELAPAPAKVRRPRRVLANGDGTHRCVTCDARLTGMQKKCESCKARDVRAAAMAMLELRAAA